MSEYQTTPAPGSPAPAQPAAPSAPDPGAQPPTSPAPAPAGPSGPAVGDVVHVRHDNGRGTVTETTAIVVRTVDVPDVVDGKQQDSTHVEYDVAPVSTMRVRADHLVDEHAE